MRALLIQVIAGLLVSGAVHAADPVLSLSLAIPSRDDDRVLLLHEKAAHFHVILSNVSDKPQRVWEEWCSWGYYAFTFEIKDEAGKSWIVKKKPIETTYDHADWWTLAPGEHVAFDVFFTDSKVWDGFPHPVNDSQTVFVRAIFEVKPDTFSEKHGAWTGRVVSDTKKLRFYHHAK
jgi:hypothetical protein